MYSNNNWSRFTGHWFLVLTCGTIVGFVCQSNRIVQFAPTEWMSKWVSEWLTFPLYNRSRQDLNNSDDYNLSVNKQLRRICMTCRSQWHQCESWSGILIRLSADEQWHIYTSKCVHNIFISSKTQTFLCLLVTLLWFFICFKVEWLPYNIQAGLSDLKSVWQV